MVSIGLSAGRISGSSSNSCARLENMIKWKTGNWQALAEASCRRSRIQESIRQGDGTHIVRTGEQEKRKLWRISHIRHYMKAEAEKL